MSDFGKRSADPCIDCDGGHCTMNCGPAKTPNWTRCPSTHCERAQECRSPNECSGAGKAALATGWQPIETAPKDGTEVQLAGMTPDGPRVTAGFWLVPPAPIIGDCGGECRCPEYGEPEAPSWMSNDGGFCEPWPATHWKPLSAHPSALAPSPAATVAEGVAWRPIEDSPPKGETILVSVEPTEENNVFFGKWPRKTFPAFVDERGEICDAGTWRPDGGLNGRMWRTVAWMPMPEPLGVSTAPSSPADARVRELEGLVRELRSRFTGLVYQPAINELLARVDAAMAGVEA